MPTLFITGLFRSGTTLLEKLLHQHKQIAVASQPAPLLYYYIKNVFLQSWGLERTYPINDQFAETSYTPAYFTHFLKHYQLPQPVLLNLFEQMKGYKAQYSQELLPFAATIKAGNFAHIYSQICELTAYLPIKSAVKWRGTKEILGEEYIDFLLQNGVKVALVLRDPRDMLLSTNSGKELGEIRPTLFYVRQWRKSVAYALSLQHSNLLVLRYEDLVLQTNLTLQKIASFLSVSAFESDITSKKIQSQTADVWSGNSSFEQYTSVSQASVGRFKTQLSAQAIQQVEAFCLPEMLALGYEPISITSAQYTEQLLANQKETATVTHRAFSPNFTHDPAELAKEQSRLALLQMPEPPITEVQKYFIFEKAYHTLKLALS